MVTIPRDGLERLPGTDNPFRTFVRRFQINSAVDDFDTLLAKRRVKGLNVLEQLDDENFDRFAWILDPQGNKVDLGQPERAS